MPKAKHTLVTGEAIRRYLGGDDSPMPRSTHYKAIARGELPRAVQIGPKCFRYVLEEHVALVDARIAARDSR